MHTTHNLIIFFDGQCGLCNRLINIFLSLDSKEQLIFSPLQGATAKDILPAEFVTSLDTFVFFKNGHIYTKSNAAIEAFFTLGGLFSLFCIFKIIPQFIRDAVYDFISKNRINWFGQSDSCRMPTQEERARFLD
jgi:predicted DCC family thiol-disulfide oxidoreductase YuxK